MVQRIPENQGQWITVNNVYNEINFVSNPTFKSRVTGLDCPDLTHKSRLTHICASKLVFIGSNNGFPPISMSCWFILYMKTPKWSCEKYNLFMRRWHSVRFDSVVLNEVQIKSNQIKFISHKCRKTFTQIWYVYTNERSIRKAGAYLAGCLDMGKSSVSYGNVISESSALQLVLQEA